MAIEISQYVKEIGKIGYEDKIPHRKTNNLHRPGYLDIRERMGWHIRGEFPDKLFSEKRPSEDPAWFKWRKRNYKAVTKGAINEAISDAQSLFIQSNFAIRADEETMEYISSERFGEGQDKVDFISWMHDRAFSTMMLDPHAHIVAMPVYPGSDTLPADVDLLVIDSSQILSKPGDGAFAWESYESSVLKKDGKLIYVIDDEFVYRCDERDSERGGEKFLITTIYRHNTGTNLSQILGGNSEYVKGYILYRSFLEPFCEFGDDVLEAYSTHRVGQNTMGFPIAERYQSECQYSNEYGTCYNGIIAWRDDEMNDQSMSCPGCGGTGRARPIHPGHVIEKPRPHGPDDPVIEELKYIHPPVEAIQELRKDWEQLLEEARRSISIKDIYHAQSGAAKDADKESRERMRKSIAKRFFGIVMEGVLKHIVMIRRPFDFNSFIPQVSPPTEFKLKGGAALLEDLQAIAERPPSRGIFAKKVDQYIATAYENDPHQATRSRIEIMLAPLTTKSPEELQRLELSGAISSRDVLFVEHCWVLIQEIENEQGAAMLENDITWWRERVNARFEERFPPEAAPAPLVPPEPEA